MKSYKILASFLMLLLSQASCATLIQDASTKQLPARQALATHNQLRAQHNAPALTWDDTLAAYAARYASHCNFKHSGGPYGENLAAGYPSLNTGVQVWHAEKAYYNPNNPGISMRTGHYTQMIWKSTKKLGCAYVACNGKQGTPGNFLVCEYSPAGNILSRELFIKNVQ